VFKVAAFYLDASLKTSLPCTAWLPCQTLAGQITPMQT